MKRYIILILFLLMPLKTAAYSNKIIAGGENVGIELRSDGVVIVGFYDVAGNSPGKIAGLKEGDIIKRINDNKIITITDMANEIAQSESLMNIEYKRDKMVYTTMLNLVKTGNQYKTGLYVKDSISGIGTLSFIDPGTKSFGVLGHEIVEKSTNKIFSGVSGTIFRADVVGIQKSTRGNPGGKEADYKKEVVYGQINANTIKGVYGHYTAELPNKSLTEVGNEDEIELGKAQILTVVDRVIIKKFDIMITNIDYNNNTKNLLFDVADQKLLAKTGGIVQGMSGSPIIQNNKIIGAVTHVVVDEPAKGYGIFITSMLKEADKQTQ